MWIREMHYRDELKHTIEYQFVCQNCNMPSGAVFREITAIHERKYPGHFLLSPEDQAALPVIMQNKLTNVLLLTWIAFERGEYDYLPGTSYTKKEPLANYHVNKWSALCPHCGAKQKWTPKRKLFGKSEPIDPSFLPKIDWRWETMKVNMLKRIEWVMRARPRYLTDKKRFALSGSVLGLKNSMVNDDEKVWQYVVEGLHLEFVKDLMDDEDPPYYLVNPTSLSYDALLPKIKPEFNKGESCYGFISFLGENAVTRWAMSRKGIVVRTEILPERR